MVPQAKFQELVAQDDGAAATGGLSPAAMKPVLEVRIMVRYHGTAAMKPVLEVRETPTRGLWVYWSCVAGAAEVLTMVQIYLSRGTYLSRP